MSMLCRAEPEWQRNVGQGNKTERIRGSHSLANHSPAKFICQFIFSPFYVVSASPKRGVNGLERFFGFFEKNSRFIVKFRKFFGFIFFESDFEQIRAKNKKFTAYYLLTINYEQLAK
jgi:hypothetical protein